MKDYPAVSLAKLNTIEGLQREVSRSRIGPVQDCLVDRRVCCEVMKTFGNKQLLRKWAFIVEMNEIFSYEEGCETVIADFIHALSTPEVDGRSVEEVIGNFKHIMCEL